MTDGIRRAAIFGALIAGIATAQAQTDLAPAQAFSSDAQGNPTRPEVGKPFYVTVRYSVSGSIKKAYKIRFQTAYANLATPDLTLGVGAPGGYQVTWGPIATLMDRSVPVTVTLDADKKVSESNEKNNVLNFDVVPESPQAALESYNPQLLSGQLFFNLSFDRRSAVPTSMTIAHPVPVSESFQEVVRQVLPSVAQVADQNGQPFLLSQISRPTISPISSDQAVVTRAVSMRINLNLLRQTTWSEVDSMSSSMPEWMGSETYIQLGNSNIVSFVGRSLPKNYRYTMSPANVAESLYRAVLQNLKYDGKAGQVPDAANTLKSKKGDCGGLSAAYVAALRTVGIPARTVAGFTEGSSQWHVWAEFYLPNAGWVPADPAYAKGAMPSGDTPIYFGVVPNLNARIATSFGLDREAGGVLLPLLQSARVQWTGKNVRVANASSTCILRVIESAN